jgi:hypothetical protein
MPYCFTAQQVHGAYTTPSRVENSAQVLSRQLKSVHDRREAQIEQEAEKIRTHLQKNKFKILNMKIVIKDNYAIFYYTFQGRLALLGANL